MWKLFESSPFLRSLNFVRVRHPERMRYLLVYPFVFTLSVLLVLRIAAGSFFSIDVSKAIQPIIPMIAILLPFFIASLAATATFSGPKGFDEPFKMRHKVKLLISFRGGSKDIDVTPRHFLSLLFSYISVLCLSLLFAGAIQSNIDLLSLLGNHTWVALIKTIFLLKFLIFLGQILVATGVVIYYLGDFIHRLEHR